MEAHHPLSFVSPGRITFHRTLANYPKVTKKVLMEHLKQMETNGLIIREEKQTFPPEVYYSISEKGKTLGPILASLELWANENETDAVNEMKAMKKAALD